LLAASGCAAKDHDIPFARVRYSNGLGTYWVECEDGHGRGREA
jgi:hypothetical protein